MDTTYERTIHDTEKTFETTRTHQLGQIERKYDPFEGETDPVVVTAVDPETGEPIVKFHLDEDGHSTDLMEASTATHVLTSAVMNEPSARARAEEFTGLTLDSALAFIEGQLDAGIPIESTLKAWTRDDGTITKLGVVTPSA